MPALPSTINGVRVDLAPTVGNNVDERMIDGLKHCIKAQIAPGHTLAAIYISSAFDGHKLPSRHMQHKAIDISRINGSKIAIGYPQGGATRAIVDAIQRTFETYQYKRENFGPHLKKKLGKDWKVGGHEDHIHLSVN